MKISLSTARALLAIASGGQVPASQLRQDVVERMIHDGVLRRKPQGAGKAVMVSDQPAALAEYVKNHFGIQNLQEYIRVLSDPSSTRADAVEVSGNSKLRAVRTFRGFPVQTLSPVSATLNDKKIQVAPVPGTSWFIEDFEKFIPAQDVTIIGIENGENFQKIREYGQMFSPFNPMFVCRYPQSNDLLSWLKSLPNPYLHFGDLDFEGIRIYLTEYKRWLGDRCCLFIPHNIEELLARFGNRTLYQSQHECLKNQLLSEELEELVAIFHRYGKVLEQEILISGCFLGRKE
ncbi:MAG: hypothetical protein EOO15_04470 [Chitinophagaceae bacterium]|nr:MAG: hypothetical protein EOO15_04470 [Chitinophagaceae bacterium]